MSVVFNLLPLLLALAVALLIAGARRVVSDPLSQLDVEQLRLINTQGQRQLRGNADLKVRYGRILGGPLQRVAGRRGENFVRELVRRAGSPDGLTVDYFFKELGFWTLALGFLGFVSSFAGLPLWMVIGVVSFGVLAPIYQLWATGAERQETISKDLPDFLDVVAVVVSAGLGFQQAMERVSVRYGGPLGEEMQRALRDMAVGDSLRTALTAVRGRTRSESVDQFVTALIQSDELGSPLAESLNQISVDVRLEASELAKRQAAKAAPKATVITIAFFVPPTMAIMVYGMIVALR